MPKINYPEELPVYDRCVHMGYMPRERYLPLVELGEMKWTGFQRRATAVHWISKEGSDLKGPIPAGKRFSFLEHTGEVRVWQHSKRAVQPCPDRDALLTGQVLEMLADRPTRFLNHELDMAENEPSVAT